MPKFMIVGSYTNEGAKGFAKEGGTARREAVVKAAASVGGKLDAMYYAFGENDFYVVLDLPDAAAATAVSLAANVSGAVHSRTVVLMTPEEVDAALKKHV
ncbi:MAG TPA: GYD domain-containing protein, partial [Roseiarcus sp.]|nr:GYD domain-containing protein [Roseiarcus sp.]